eukprot:gene12326-8456_t
MVRSFEVYVSSGALDRIQVAEQRVVCAPFWRGQEGPGWTPPPLPQKNNNNFIAWKKKRAYNHLYVIDAKKTKDNKSVKDYAGYAGRMRMRMRSSGCYRSGEVFIILFSSFFSPCLSFIIYYYDNDDDDDDFVVRPPLPLNDLLDVEVRRCKNNNNKQHQSNTRGCSFTALFRRRRRERDTPEHHFSLRIFSQKAWFIVFHSIIRISSSSSFSCTISLSLCSRHLQRLMPADPPFLSTTSTAAALQPRSRVPPTSTPNRRAEEHPTDHSSLPPPAQVRSVPPRLHAVAYCAPVIASNTGLRGRSGSSRMAVEGGRIRSTPKEGKTDVGKNKRDKDESSGRSGGVQRETRPPPSPSALQRFRVWASEHVSAKVYDYVDALPHPLPLLTAPLLRPPPVRPEDISLLRRYLTTEVSLASLEAAAVAPHPSPPVILFPPTGYSRSNNKKKKKTTTTTADRSKEEAVRSEHTEPVRPAPPATGAEEGTRWSIRSPSAASLTVALQGAAALPLPPSSGEDVDGGLRIDHVVPSLLGAATRPDEDLLAFLSSHFASAGAAHSSSSSLSSTQSVGRTAKGSSSPPAVPSARSGEPAAAACLDASRPIDLLSAYDGDNPVHLHLLERLWRAHHHAMAATGAGLASTAGGRDEEKDTPTALPCHPGGGGGEGGIPPFRPCDPVWCSPIGFQQADPATDFRSGGLLSLVLLLLYVERYPQEWIENVGEEAASGFYPAATSINVSFWLGTLCGLIREPSPSPEDDASSQQQRPRPRPRRRRSSRGGPLLFRSLLAKFRLVEYVVKGSETLFRKLLQQSLPAGGTTDALKGKRAEAAARYVDLEDHGGDGAATRYGGDRGGAGPRLPLTHPSTSREHVAPPPEAAMAHDDAPLHRQQATPGMGAELHLRWPSVCRRCGAAWGQPSPFAAASTPLDRLSLLHAMYMRRVRHAWRGDPEKNLMAFNQLLQRVFESMEGWWVRYGGGMSTGAATELLSSAVGVPLEEVQNDERKKLSMLRRAHEKKKGVYIYIFMSSVKPERERERLPDEQQQWKEEERRTPLHKRKKEGKLIIHRFYFSTTFLFIYLLLLFIIFYFYIYVISLLALLLSYNHKYSATYSSWRGATTGDDHVCSVLFVEYNNNNNNSNKQTNKGWSAKMGRKKTETYRQFWIGRLKRSSNTHLDLKVRIESERALNPLCYSISSYEYYPSLYNFSFCFLETQKSTKNKNNNNNNNKTDMPRTALTTDLGPFRPYDKSRRLHPPPRRQMVRRCKTAAGGRKRDRPTTRSNDTPQKQRAVVEETPTAPIPFADGAVTPLALSDTRAGRREARTVEDTPTLPPPPPPPVTSRGGGAMKNAATQQIQMPGAQQHGTDRTRGRAGDVLPPNGSTPSRPPLGGAGEPTTIYSETALAVASLLHLVRPFLRPDAATPPHGRGALRPSVAQPVEGVGTRLEDILEVTREISPADAIVPPSQRFPLVFLRRAPVSKGKMSQFGGDTVKSHCREWAGVALTALTTAAAPGDGDGLVWQHTAALLTMQALDPWLQLLCRQAGAGSPLSRARRLRGTWAFFDPEAEHLEGVVLLRGLPRVVVEAVSIGLPPAPAVRREASDTDTGTGTGGGQAFSCGAAPETNFLCPERERRHWRRLASNYMPAAYLDLLFCTCPQRDGEEDVAALGVSKEEGRNDGIRCGGGGDTVAFTVAETIRHPASFLLPDAPQTTPAGVERARTSPCMCNTVWCALRYLDPDAVPERWPQPTAPYHETSSQLLTGGLRRCVLRRAALSGGPPLLFRVRPQRDGRGRWCGSGEGATTTSSFVVEGGPYHYPNHNMLIFLSLSLSLYLYPVLRSDELQMTSTADTNTKPPAEAQSGGLSYLRGFYQAERRRTVVNPADDRSFPALLGQYTLAVAPMALLWVGGLWVATRARRGGVGGLRAGMKGSAPGARATPSGGPEAGESFWSELKKVVQQAMTPLAPRDFRVKVAGTGFNDVLGCPEAVAQVRQYVQFLQRPGRFTRLGGRLPKGCLLTGPPGTGKTLLAKAVAGEAQVPFFSCNGADFLELYVGSGPKRVRELFAEARKNAPCVVFIDELDAVGSRSAGGGGGTGVDAEENRTINQLLAEIDGIQPAEAVIVFGATNFRDNVDAALLRDGRFDRKVELDVPDLVGRTDIFDHYLRRIELALPTGNSPPVSQEEAQRSLPPLDLESQRRDVAARLAAFTPGITPATIHTIVNEAAIQSAVAGRTAVPAEVLFPAVDDVLLGKRRQTMATSGPISDDAAAGLRYAWHEAGHTLMAWALQPHQTPVLHVSVAARHVAGRDRGSMPEVLMNPNGGYTRRLGREALESPTELRLFTDVCVLLAGREAEALQTTAMRRATGKAGEQPADDAYAGCSLGAQNDYQLATQKALQLFLSFGMPTLRLWHQRLYTQGETDAQRGSAAGGTGSLLSFEPQRLEAGRMHQRASSRSQHSAEEAASEYLEVARVVVAFHLKHYRPALEQLATRLAKERSLGQEAVAALLRETVPLTRLTLREMDDATAEHSATQIPGPAAIHLLQMDIPAAYGSNLHSFEFATIFPRLFIYFCHAEPPYLETKTSNTLAKAALPPPHPSPSLPFLYTHTHNASSSTVRCSYNAAPLLLNSLHTFFFFFFPPPPLLLLLPPPPPLFFFFFHALLLRHCLCLPPCRACCRSFRTAAQSFHCTRSPLKTPAGVCCSTARSVEVPLDMEHTPIMNHTIEMVSSFPLGLHPHASTTATLKTTLQYGPTSDESGARQVAALQQAHQRELLLMVQRQDVCPTATNPAAPPSPKRQRPASAEPPLNKRLFGDPLVFSDQRLSIDPLKGSTPRQGDTPNYDTDANWKEQHERDAAPSSMPAQPDSLPPHYEEEEACEMGEDTTEFPQVPERNAWGEEYEMDDSDSYMDTGLISEGGWRLASRAKTTPVALGPYPFKGEVIEETPLSAGRVREYGIRPNIQEAPRHLILTSCRTPMPSMGLAPASDLSASALHDAPSRDDRGKTPPAFEPQNIRAARSDTQAHLPFSHLRDNAEGGRTASAPDDSLAGLGVVQRQHGGTGNAVAAVSNVAEKLRIANLNMLDTRVYDKYRKSPLPITEVERTRDPVLKQLLGSMPIIAVQELPSAGLLRNFLVETLPNHKILMPFGSSTGVGILFDTLRLQEVQACQYFPMAEAQGSAQIGKGITITRLVPTTRERAVPEIVVVSCHVPSPKPSRGKEMTDEERLRYLLQRLRPTVQKAKESANGCPLVVSGCFSVTKSSSVWKNVCDDVFPAKDQWVNLLDPLSETNRSPKEVFDCIDYMMFLPGQGWRLLHTTASKYPEQKMSLLSHAEVGHVMQPPFVSDHALCWADISLEVRPPPPMSGAIGAAGDARAPRIWSATAAYGVNEAVAVVERAARTEEFIPGYCGVKRRLAGAAHTTHTHTYIYIWYCHAMEVGDSPAPQDMGRARRLCGVWALCNGGEGGLGQLGGVQSDETWKKRALRGRTPETEAQVVRRDSSLYKLLYALYILFVVAVFLCGRGARLWSSVHPGSFRAQERCLKQINPPLVAFPLLGVPCAVCSISAADGACVWRDLASTPPCLFFFSLLFVAFASEFLCAKTVWTTAMSYGAPVDTGSSGFEGAAGPQPRAPAFNKTDFQLLFPQYIDAALTPRQGRRLTRSQAVNTPTIAEMLDALRALGYKRFIRDGGCSYPRSQGDAYFPLAPRECVRVAIKEPRDTHYIRKSDFDTEVRAAVVSGIETKMELMRRVAEYIKTTQPQRPSQPTVEEEELMVAVTCRRTHTHKQTNKQTTTTKKTTTRVYIREDGGGATDDLSTPRSSFFSSSDRAEAAVRPRSWRRPLLQGGAKGNAYSAALCWLPHGVPFPSPLDTPHQNFKRKAKKGSRKPSPLLLLGCGFLGGWTTTFLFQRLYKIIINVIQTTTTTTETAL